MVQWEGLLAIATVGGELVSYGNLVSGHLVLTRLGS